jgi:hypothetical protein
VNIVAKKSRKMGSVLISVKDSVIANFIVIKYPNLMVIKECINCQ